MRYLPWLLLAITLLPCLAWALDAPAPRRAALAALAASGEQLKAGELDRALDLARRATGLDPQLAPAFEWLGTLCERKGLREEALDAFARALALEPGLSESIAGIARVFGRGNFPESLARNTPAALPAACQMVALRLDDPRLEAAAGSRRSYLVCLPNPPREGDPATDYRYGVSYQRAAYVLLMPAGRERWQLACRVHFKPGWEGLADQCARLVGALQVLAQAHLGPPPGPARPLEVWLTEEGRAGAEGWSGSIYLCGIATERQPSEWVRQLAHELGHATLAGGVGGLGQPEPWANGRIGEVLFVRWLLAARVATGPPLPWVSDKLAAWQREQLAVSVGALEAVGGPDRAGGTGWQAVERATGLVCSLEQLFGPGLLTELLAGTTRRPELGAVLESARYLLTRRLQGGLAVWPGSGWLFTPTGTLEVLSGEGQVGIRKLRAGDTMPAPGGWLRVAVEQGSAPLRLRLAAGNTGAGSPPSPL